MVGWVIGYHNGSLFSKAGMWIKYLQIIKRNKIALKTRIFTLLTAVVHTHWRRAVGYGGLSHETQPVFSAASSPLFGT